METVNRKIERKRFAIGARFRYWFDNRMTKGSLGLIRMLIVVSVLFAVLMGFLIIALRFSDKSETASVVWDSIATVINAWMPFYDDGSPGYLAIMTVTAIAGVLFTSVLIGIITSAIEEKIESLKKGNSIVLEKNHIVVLGFCPGEYTLLHQLILAAAGKPSCVVLAEDMDREEMEHALYENLNIPRTFRFVCRTADITNPSSLEKCSIETCKTVIINPVDDAKTIKAILAVSALLSDKGVPEISVNAILSKGEYRFPVSLAESNNITTLETNNILAKMIAHSCTQNGLSESFREVFNFEGSEFYLVDISGIDGLTFEELMINMDNAVPAGYYRDGKIVLNPQAGETLCATDRILVFSEEKESARLGKIVSPVFKTVNAGFSYAEEKTDTVIIGHNETLPVIIRELPENVSHVYLVGNEIPDEEHRALCEVAKGRGLQLRYIEGDPRSEKIQLEVAQMAEHIVILNDHAKDAEEADMEAIFILLNIRDIRMRYGLHFNITMEMRKEHNQKLVGRGDHTDFLVSSSMSSLILAQLAENPELIDVFREILSNKGNELFLKTSQALNLAGTVAVRDLRQIMLAQGYILLGYVDVEKNSHFNLPLDKAITLTPEDCLIVLGET